MTAHDNVDSAMIAELHNGILSFVITLYFTLAKSKSKEKALEEVQEFLISLSDKIVNQTNT